ncbi:hypothetical protein H8959_019454 [Pygathrix nigripes]
MFTPTTLVSGHGDKIAPFHAEGTQAVSGRAYRVVYHERESKHKKKQLCLRNRALRLSGSQVREQGTEQPLPQNHGTIDLADASKGTLTPLPRGLLIPAMTSPINNDVRLFGSRSFLSHETVKKYPAPLAAVLIKVDPRVLPCGSKTRRLAHLLTPSRQRRQQQAGLPPSHANHPRECSWAPPAPPGQCSWGVCGEDAIQGAVCSSWSSPSCWMRSAWSFCCWGSWPP